MMPETLDGNTIYITLESDERDVIIARATPKEELTFSRLTRPDVGQSEGIIRLRKVKANTCYDLSLPLSSGDYRRFIDDLIEQNDGTLDFERLMEQAAKARSLLQKMDADIKTYLK